ncbi:vitamin B12-dependent ribonucleotide reductase [Desulfonatronospira sp.]|uniref:vitamin B12-dependent ribonucleotide reductase n=1 Tax=Desulfonatronospira sp. TaxID=1962951 RepID=UPI0025BBEC20|nr:vitamin B12-dependent ribonucleotide reductase [Desulfonatronospira sp.]
MKILPMPQDLPEPILSPNAKTVLSKRYLRKGDEGQPLEDFRAMFWRVAASVAGEEEKYRDSPYNSLELGRSFYQMLMEGKFLPNSPTLMNAGTDLGQLAACFVLPVGDSMDEIFDSIKHAALIHKSGGGTGFSFSRLRPKDSRVGSTGGIASGPLSFLKIFNTATEQVKQGGTRRGANMGILRVDHPDIIDFIRAKERDGELNNFNLSVALTEKFMQAVESGSDYPLVAPQSGEETGRQNAREVFSLLVHKAWESGDPGIIFLDRINKDNPTPDLGEMESTNPCGEQPLLPYEACNLGSINLDRFYSPTAEDGIDWERLQETVHLSVRFLDNVIDLSRYPLERITEMVHKTRKIGLGVMGFADLLFQLRVAYDSHRGLQLGEKIMDFVQNESRSASRILAQERGPFPEYENSIYARQNLGPYRNATTTTIAPTGTLSIIAGCSSGIEPIFALSFTRQVLDGERLLEVNPHLEEALKNTRSYSDKLMEDVAKKGSIKQMEHLDQDLRDVFVTSMDVSAKYHLKMQAAFQKYTDNAVSKTVNLPHQATQEDVWQIYWMAYEMGCKGVTVYRDGCRADQVLSTQDGEKARQDRAQGRKTVRERPEVVYGFTQKVKTGLGELYLTVNEVEGKPFEVFATIGRSGRSITAKAEAIGRLVSLALRSGIDVSDVVKQIKGIGGEHPVFQKKGLLLSIPDAVGWVLENRYLQGHSFKPDINGFNKPKCPECEAELLFQEGCFVCQACGYTKCG